MKGFDETARHPFEAPYIHYHLAEAEDGSQESTEWLLDNLRRVLGDKARYLVEAKCYADDAGCCIDEFDCWRIEQLRVGGSRRARQKRGQQGQRGPGFGEHVQLRMAAEMWKEHHLLNRPLREAADHVNDMFTQNNPQVRRTRSSPINAYYRFTKPDEFRTLCMQLAFDFVGSDVRPDILEKGLDEIRRGMKG